VASAGGRISLDQGPVGSKPSRALW